VESIRQFGNYSLAAHLEKARYFDSLEEAHQHVTKYCNTSGDLLRIWNSFENRFKHLICQIHKNCKLQININKDHKRNQYFINPMHPVHTSTILKTTKDGRKLKIDRRHLREAATLVQETIKKSVTAMDVMVTCANKFEVADTDYISSHHAQADMLKSKAKEEVLSFQKIIPYLKQLKEQNPDSTIDYSRNEDMLINSCFVALGHANEACNYCKRLVALDASFLKG